LQADVLLRGSVRGRSKPSVMALNVGGSSSKLPVEQLGEVWQVRLVMARTAPAVVTTAQGSPAWLWVGVDERGRELEVVVVQA